MDYHVCTVSFTGFEIRLDPQPPLPGIKPNPLQHVHLKTDDIFRAVQLNW